VSFDQRSQAETLQAVKEAARSSGRQVRERFEAWAAAAKGWLLAPWDFRRALGLAGALAALAALAWAGVRHGPALWRRLALRTGSRGEDPVRREAGRWLGRLAAAESGPDQQGVRAELQRLRFGPRSSWAKPEAVFRRARQTCRTARPRRRLTRP
jgi:protein-glutamine gamma-glutamyltransferase